jgi:hypothetical protein
MNHFEFRRDLLMPSCYARACQDVILDTDTAVVDGAPAHAMT